MAAAGTALRRWPLLLAVPAVAALLSPQLAAWMIYDRTAILHGEVWRLVTGHWVHFSAGHLICDALVLGCGAWVIERRGVRQFPAIGALSALAIGLVLLLAQPELAFYGGLSGLAMTSSMLAGLLSCQGQGYRSGFGPGLLLLVTGRLLFDLAGSRFALVDIAGQGVVPVPLSHAVGALCGLLAWLWLKRSAATGRSPHQPAPALRSGRHASDRA